MELMHASRQWMSRPDDERFTSLPELYNKVHTVRDESTASVISTRKLRVLPHVSGDVKSIMIEHSEHEAPAIPTHWSFGQMAALAKAPAGYLRSLPGPLVADCMNYGLRFSRDAEDLGLLRHKAPVFEGASSTDVVNASTIRAATGPRYGRIWNDEIVAALMDKFGDGATGQWKVPGEFGKDVPITKANTTIYGSDRDMFVFLADEKNRVEVANRRNGQSGSLARGFFVWNSEVGSQSIGAAFFLFDYACSNRIVWGAREFKEIRLRHTVSAPDRWLEEITPVLMDYSNSAAASTEATIKAAQDKKMADDLDKFLANRFTARVGTLAKDAHEREEGRPMESLWDVVTGVTAYAKTIKNQDDRVALEREAGRVLDLVAA